MIPNSTLAPGRVPPLTPEMEAAVKRQPEVCRYCGCTPSHACQVLGISGMEACYWIDKLDSICSAPACREQHARLVHQLVTELQAERCCCGRRKKARNTFCPAHYWLLPTEEMRRDLYCKVGAGYEEAYARARRFLLNGGAR